MVLFKIWHFFSVYTTVGIFHDKELLSMHSSG